MLNSTLFVILFNVNFIASLFWLQTMLQRYPAMAKTMMNQNRYNQMNKKGHKGQNQQPPMGMRGPQMGPMPPGMGLPPRPMMPGGPHGMGPMGHMMDGGMPNNMDQDEMGVQSHSGQ